jgi:hypothetical protein
MIGTDGGGPRLSGGDPHPTAALGRPVVALT